MVYIYIYGVYIYTYWLDIPSINQIYPAKKNIYPIGFNQPGFPDAHRDRQRGSLLHQGAQGRGRRLGPGEKSHGKSMKNPWTSFHWIGLLGKIWTGNPWFFLPSNFDGLSCKNSHHPILWSLENVEFIWFIYDLTWKNTCETSWTQEFHNCETWWIPHDLTG